MVRSSLDDFLTELDGQFGKYDTDNRRDCTLKLLQEADDELAKTELLQLAEKGALYSRISGTTRIMEPFDGEVKERAVVDLVQQGGSMFGVALLGYTYVMERVGVRFRSMAGTSAGAINTLLLAAIPETIYEEKTPFGNRDRQATKSEILAYVVANKNFKVFLDRSGTLGLFQQWLLKRIKYVGRILPAFKVLLPLIFLAISLMLYIGLDKYIFNVDNGLTGTEVAIYHFLAGTVGILSVLLLVTMLLFALFRGKMGFNPGEVPYYWMKDILGTKFVNIHTTQELMDRKRSERQPVYKAENGVLPVEAPPRLVLITANLTHNRIVKFPEQNVDYWKADFAPLVNPAAYVRASMSLPFIFYSLMPADKHVQGKVGETYDTVELFARFVDGGMLSNFPIREFHVPPTQDPKYPTFGVLLGTAEDEVPRPTPAINQAVLRIPVFKFIGSFISTFRNFYDRDFLQTHPELKQLVEAVNTSSFNSLDFGMSFDNKKAIFREGAKAAIRQLLKFNWTEYVVIRKQQTNKA